MKVRQKKNGKYFIDLTCKGQRVRRVIGYSKREAEDALATIRSDIVRGKYGLPIQKKDTNFTAFAKDYLKLYSKQNKRSWHRDEISLKHLTSFFKGKTLTQITPELIEKYKVKRKEHVSPATVNRELACLKTTFTKAIEWRRANYNPVKDVNFFRENNTQERILNPEESNRLIKASSSHLKSLIKIALNTALRRNEILHLTWKNINFAKGYISIENSKSGKSRKIPMNQIVYETLKEMNKVNNYVFYNSKTRNPIKNVKTAFKSACKRAGIENLRLHDLRHTAASRMIETGVDLVTVSKILGHSSIQMTMRYAHPTPENMRRAVDKLGEFFCESRQKVDTPPQHLDYNNLLSSLFLSN